MNTKAACDEMELFFYTLGKRDAYAEVFMLIRSGGIESLATIAKALGDNPHAKKFLEENSK